MSKKEELLKIAEDNSPSPTIALGYTEHQMDVVSSLLIDLMEGLDQTTLSDTTKNKLQSLKDIMQHSSIDFDNLTHPLQAYKIPKTIETKADFRVLQTRYLTAQIREGAFGE